MAPCDGWAGTIRCAKACIVRSEADLQSSVVCELSPGTPVWIASEAHSANRRRCFITSPCRGWVTAKYIDAVNGKNGTATAATQKSVLLGRRALPTREASAVPPKPATPDAAAPLRPAGGFQQRIGLLKKVVIVGLSDGDKAKYNGHNGSVEEFNFETGKYKVKLVVLGESNVGMKSANHTFLWLGQENIVLHQDQVARDQATFDGDALVLLGAGDAKRHLYQIRMDPQYWYDKAIERVFEASNDFAVLDLPPQRITDTTVLKRAYRKISLAVHPDKNSHPQATDAFRKAYGAFETLMDEKQQRRLLWLMGKLDVEEKNEFRLEEDEAEDEYFQWWWEASVPEIEKQVAEFEGQRLDEFGAMWISDGLGGNVEEVRWVGLGTARRLHEEGGAIFIDVRDPADFTVAHISGAYNTPLLAIIDHGLVNVFTEAGDGFIRRLLVERTKPIIVYSEVATPFSRCRAFCRWLLRAGHQTIKVQRVRRLRGGMFGWRQRGGPVSLPIEGGRCIEETCHN